MGTVNKDTLWKGIIEDLFEEFCFYFFPDWAEKVADFSQQYDFLDKELDSLLPEANQKRRTADKLVRVRTKTGQTQWVLVHIEVQGYRDPEFDQRMFDYFYRIRDRFRGEAVMALVIYTDDQSGFHPSSYQYEYEQTKLSYQFQTFTLYNKTEAELNKPGNPFSVVMKTAKKALENKTKDPEQLAWKTALVRGMVQEGYSQETIYSMLKFIRHYVQFSNKDTKKQFEQSIEQIFNKQVTMGLHERIIEDLTTQAREEGEARGEAKGEAKGIEIAKKQGIRKALQKGILSIEEIADLFEVTVEYVRKVQKEEAGR